MSVARPRVLLREAMRMAAIFACPLLTLSHAAQADLTKFDKPPVLVERVRCTYPALARDEEVRGRVTLNVLVGKDGRVESTKVVRGVERLNEAAANCARHWVFNPALSKGMPVPAWALVSVSLPLDACPGEVLAGARAGLVARVGEKFFKESLTLDSTGCVLLPGWEGRAKVYRWALAYTLRIPTKPWVTGTIRVEVDTTGVQVPWQPIHGIGDCAHHPEECTFSVDEDHARAIARRAGLEAGLSPWWARFRWMDRPRATYVWYVRNTLQSDGHGGREAIIDANTGELLSLGGWFVDVQYDRLPAPRDTSGGAHR